MRKPANQTARLLTLLNVLLILLVGSTTAHAATDVLLEKITSQLVPSPVEYAVIGPAGFQELTDLPLILNLHGGGGSRKDLLRQKELWDRAWQDKSLPPVVFVTPSVTARGLYMNFKDGAKRWEDFLVGPFLAHLRQTLPVSKTPQRTFLMGVSMGGMGSLRIAFKHPQMFGAVAALEPGIEPVLQWRDIKQKHRFWRSDDLFEQAFGSPVDEAYWAANNPATIASKQARQLQSSGLQIYIDAADEDEFWLYEGAEFLHRVLWQQRVRHEYHLVRGANHIGPSLLPRLEEAAQFLVRTYSGWGELPLRTRAAQQWIKRQQRTADGVEHYAESPELDGN